MTARRQEIPADVLDRMYEAEPGDFVAARNAAAKELKAQGKDDAAAATRALRRPSAPAAAINRAVRAEPAQARALLDAARDLQRAHEAAVAGDPDRDALRAATAAERQAINALVATAGREAGGRPLSADVERRIRDTLEAVALDPEVREAFAAGRLSTDARAAGLALGGIEAAPGAKAPQRRRDDDAKRKAERERREREQAVRRAQQAVDRSRADAERTERTRERADAAARAARKALREAETELRRAQRRAKNP